MTILLIFVGLGFLAAGLYLIRSPHRLRMSEAHGYHLEKFFAHANGVYDDKLVELPEQFSDMLESFGKGAAGPELSSIMVSLLSDRDRGRGLTAETQHQAREHARILTKGQAGHLVRAFLHAGLASAYSSRLFPERKASLFIKLLENPPEAERMAKKIVQHNWNNADCHAAA